MSSGGPAPGIEELDPAAVVVVLPLFALGTDVPQAAIAAPAIKRAMADLRVCNMVTPQRFWSSIAHQPGESDSASDTKPPHYPKLLLTRLPNEPPPSRPGSAGGVVSDPRTAHRVLDPLAAAQPQPRRPSRPGAHAIASRAVV